MDAPGTSQRPRSRRRNHAVWIGLVLAGWSPVGLFLPVALTHAPITAALAISALGLWRAFRKHSVYGGQILAGPAFALSLWLVVRAIAAPLGDPAIRYEIVVDGRTRSYRVRRPVSYDSSVPAPLLVVFHGDKEPARHVERLTRLSDLAEDEGILAVYPDGLRRTWNDGRPAARDGPDDVGFTRAMISAVEDAYAVDSSRIYAVGFSRGGSFALRLACELSARVAGVAAVGAGMRPSALAGCRPTPARPVPALFIHGTADRFARWERFGRAAADWAAVMGCGADPEVTTLADVRDDGTRVRRERFGACMHDVEVVLYVVEGGGHTWPGGRYLPRFLFGRVSRDLDASTAIWEFFRRAAVEPRADGRDDR